MKGQFATSGAGSRFKTTIHKCPICGSSDIKKSGSFHGKCDRCKGVFSWFRKVKETGYY